MISVAELLERLDDAGERRGIEAKRGLGDAAEETICAFVNEPDLGGGYLLFGVEETADGSFQIVGVSDPQKLQQDLTSICAGRFSQPIRPEVELETVDGRHVVVAFVPEASASAKPVFIQRKGLDKGAYRRIGSGDHRCSGEDLRFLLRLADMVAFEQSAVAGAVLDDLDPDAIEHYRRRLLRVEPASAMGGASQEEVVLAVSGGQREGGSVVPNVAGVLLFGKKLALRRLLPAQYADYIRVPGTVWVPSAEERYEDAREIREPLLRAFERAFSEVYDSLPRPFRLPPGQLERDDRPRLPERALREVLVNALMHRDYRENRPMQIIRYSDRIEVHNAGYSLTPEDRFGEPGSTLRNPCLSAVFRDVRLAEAKGTGIRAVRRAMKDAGMEPPVFQSDRGANLFIATLWLHNLLDEDELGWLGEVEDRGLTDPQKHALVVARRTGKVANGTLRDLSALDTLAASRELRTLRDKGLLVMRGKAAGAFYVLSPAVLEREKLGSQKMHGAPKMHGGQNVQGGQSPQSSQQTQRRMGQAPAAMGQAAGGAMGEAPDAMREAPASPVGEVGERAPSADFSPDLEGMSPPMPPRDREVPRRSNGEVPGLPLRKKDLPVPLRRELRRLGKRPAVGDVTAIIRKLCEIRPLTKAELAALLDRSPKYVAERYVASMVASGDLVLLYPDNPAHPKQAYWAPQHRSEGEG